MNPNYARTNSNQILEALRLITTQVKAAPNAFNLSANDLLGLNAVQDQLGTAAADQKVAEADFRHKVGIKDDALRSAAQVLGAAAKIALVSGASDADLRSIGLARPAKPVRPTSIPQPTGLVAQGLPGGSVRLAWGRNGNPQGTAFALEWSPDGLAWEIVEVTTRASLTLAGYAPGTAAWFRVSAKRAGLSSPLSEVVSIYAPVAAARVRLKVA